MPIYSFIDKKSQEEYEITMSYDELEVYLKDNPNVNQSFRMNIVDPVGAGITKPPADFQKYVLGKIKASNPHADAVASRRWSIPKEI